ncbi:MAG: polysaccharide deacetylase family protein [Solirubrobacteraceae bacterium]|nr:polysaccharide deacetylase family protein [Solirubrobacteraceae bacterium]
MSLADHGRFPYTPITAGTPVEWPHGKRLALYVAVAIEHFPYGEGALGLSYSPGIPQPNTFNWAWREYGNRVGGFRLLDALTGTAMPPTVLLNTAAYEHCPELLAAYREAGAEFVGHGATNAVHPNGLSLDDERAMLVEVRDAIERAEGRRPAGWMSPGANPSAHTEDLLAECGYGYTLDWPHDERPNWMTTSAGPLLSVPYPHELNDVPAIALHHATGRDFADAIIDGVTELREAAAASDTPLVCGIVAHSFIVGQPHRLRPFRAALEQITASADDLWLTTPGAIAERFAAACPPPAA